MITLIMKRLKIEIGLKSAKLRTGKVRRLLYGDFVFNDRY
ncbi:hypothetical protein LPICM17_380069 [Lactococcus piscium]|nr:hypothetical protein LPICM17_380069 [Lactococcus piscium]